MQSVVSVCICDQFAEDIRSSCSLTKVVSAAVRHIRLFFSDISDTIFDSMETEDEDEDEDHLFLLAEAETSSYGAAGVPICVSGGRQLTRGAEQPTATHAINDDLSLCARIRMKS